MIIDFTTREELALFIEKFFVRRAEAKGLKKSTVRKSKHTEGDKQWFLHSQAGEKLKETQFLQIEAPEEFLSLSSKMLLEIKNGW